MNEHDEAFAQKMQRLRHTGVGGITAPSYEAMPAGSVKIRKGDPAYINMRVEGGWAVANPITKKGVSQNSKDKEQKAKQDGSIKVFATTNMDTKPQIKTPNEPVATTTATQDTEESIIKEIIALQRKLAALREK